MLPIISLMILIALIGAIVTLFTKTKEQARMIALATSVVTLIGALYMFFRFDSESPMLQFVDSFNWIPSLGVTYTVGVDGISMPLVLLTAIVVPLVVLYSWNESKDPGKFYAMILATYAGVIGVFTSMDFFLFYVFWELSIIPMFFMINMWGGPEKGYASIKFLLYTHVASLVMLLGIFAMYFGTLFQTGIATFDIPTLLAQYQLIESDLARTMIFIALLIGFIVKMPAVPFHSWLPHAYVQAPTAGTILMAAIMSKMGAYALFRFILPMLPFTGSTDLMVSILAALGVLSIIYGAFLALAQDDLKRMVAFSSVSHMGFVTLGAMAFVPLSVSGAMFQMFSHGLITCLMFMSIGAIQVMTGTRLISELGGLAQKMPKLAFLMVAGFMAYLGLPGFSGFIAEFTVLNFSYISLPSYVIAAIFAIVITAAYHLWALQRAMFGVFNEKLGDIHDISNLQTFSMAVFVLLALYFGLNPSPVMDMIITNAEQIVGLMAVAGV